MNNSRSPDEAMHQQTSQLHCSKKRNQSHLTDRRSSQLSPSHNKTQPHNDVTSRFFGSFFDAVNDDDYSMSTSTSAAQVRSGGTTGSESTSHTAVEFARKAGARHVSRPLFGNPTPPFTRMHSLEDDVTTSGSRVMTSNETSSSRVEQDTSREFQTSGFQYPYSSALVASEQAKKLREFINNKSQTVDLTSRLSKDDVI